MFAYIHIKTVHVRFLFFCLSNTSCRVRVNVTEVATRQKAKKKKNQIQNETICTWVGITGFRARKTQPDERDFTSSKIVLDYKLFGSN